MNRWIRKLAAALTASSLLAAAAEARADSKEECANAYEQTQSLREQGKLLEARKQAVVCSARTCSIYVTTDCVQWFAEIEANLPTVVIAARDAAGTDTSAVRVSVDGQVIAERLDGKALPLDPGEHVVRFELEGAEAIEQKVLLRQGEKNRVLSASFEKARPAAPRPPVPAAPAPPPAPAAPAPAPEPGPAPHRGGVPVWAWVSGAGGLALLGVGAGFGVAGLQAQSKLFTDCGTHDLAVCPASRAKATGAIPLANQRNLDRDVVVGVGAGGAVAIGAAVIGMVRAPGTTPEARSSFVMVPLGLPSGGGVAMSGSF